MESAIAYFDNAATTFPKPEVVYDFADSFYRNSGGNAGRGENVLAMRAGTVARQAKDNLRALLNCPAREVVFISSATDALNRIILGLGLEKGDSVFITPFEHNAVTRPLHHLETAVGIRVEQLTFDSETLLPLFDEIEAQFNKVPPHLVVMTHASNVCGAIVPILDIARVAKRYGATVVVDMSQTAGLVPTNLASQLIDFAVFAGHKTLYSPFGIGGFLCHPGVRLNPVLYGGNGINSIEQDMPIDIVQMCEIGSSNAYAIAGLKASTEWILEQGTETIYAREMAHRQILVNVLNGCDEISIIASNAQCDLIGIVSAAFKSYAPDEVEQILNKFNIAVRSGLHCAPTAHRFLGTLPAGSVRFSVGAFNEENDFRVLENALSAMSEL